MENTKLAKKHIKCSHTNLPEEFVPLGVSEKMIRLAIGIESVHDIIDDINQALNKVDG